MEYLFIVNLVLVFISGWLAFTCYAKGNTVGGWVNLFASAINAAAFASHIF